MFQFGANSKSSSKALILSNLANNSRSIPHIRIDDEDEIYKKYEKGNKIGQGSFGIVYEVKNRETLEKFAIKIINKEKSGGKCSYNFENEVLIMKSVTHQHLIKLEEVFETKKRLFLITELCESGELAKLIKHHGPIGEKPARKIMIQILDAISYLHKNDVVHRDLKLENILLKEYDMDNGSFFIKITDFGLSTLRETMRAESMFEDFCGTPLYMAPEIIDNYPYSQLCDIWALGIIMFILLTSHSPFTAETESKLREQIRRADIDTKSSLYKKLTPEAKDCLNRMLKVETAHRITSSELLEHPWILGKKLEEIQEKKNVLELMQEMLEEQEHHHIMNTSFNNSDNSDETSSSSKVNNHHPRNDDLDTEKSDLQLSKNSTLTSRPSYSKLLNKATDKKSSSNLNSKKKY